MSCNPSLQKPIGPGTNAVVVGGGRSGRAAVRLLFDLGCKVRLLDKDAGRLPEDFTAWTKEAGIRIIDGDHSRNQFVGMDILIPSPGVAVSTLKPLMPVTGPPEILAETELAWRLLQGEPVVGITGTSGKTTTTSLCSAMLAARGLDVFTGGNIGTPLSEYVLARRREGRARADVIVLELSSFQLQTTVTLRPKVGLLLNVSENHLDYHADMAEYIAAKMRLFRCQEEGDLAIFGPTLKGLPETCKLRSRILYFDAEVRRFPATALLGKHNQANAEAAWQAARQFGVTLDEATRAMSEFKPLANRLEAVAERNGVLYVNDSKCTTVEALRVALEAFDRPVHLLAGGKFKGGDLDSLTGLVRSKVKTVNLYGAARDIFSRAFAGTTQVSWDETLREALARASRQAVPGDVVLLAPATASYDQYSDYMARGDDFRTAVLEYGSENGEAKS